jgi:hypothetical protein
MPWSVVHSHNDVRPSFGELGLVQRADVKFVLAAYPALADAGFASSVLAAGSMVGMNWKGDPRWERSYTTASTAAPFGVPGTFISEKSWGSVIPLR